MLLFQTTIMKSPDGKSRFTNKRITKTCKECNKQVGQVIIEHFCVSVYLTYSYNNVFKTVAVLLRVSMYYS